MKTLTFIRHAQSVANAGGVSMPNCAVYTFRGEGSRWQVQADAAMDRRIAGTALADAPAHL